MLFLGGIVCVYLGKQVGWNYAFLAAGIVMIIGVVLFLFIRNELGPIRRFSIRKDGS